MSLYRTLRTAGLLGAALLAAAPARAETLRVGYQRFGTMILMKERGTLESALAPLGWTVSWILFPSGPPLLEAMNAGAVDAGMTGETPPVFAQAADAPLVYVAAEPPAPEGEAIVVPHDSRITTLAGLKGKRVAFNRGSNVHYLVLAALRHAGLRWSDITPVYLAPADSPAALRTGAVDALAIWDPYLSAVLAETGARVLHDASGIAENREFVLASRELESRHRAVADALVAALAASDAWASAHREEASGLLSRSSGLPLPVVRRAVANLTFGAVPLDPATVAAQQAVADALFDASLMPDRVRIADDVPGAAAR